MGHPGVLSQLGTDRECPAGRAGEGVTPLRSQGLSHGPGESLAAFLGTLPAAGRRQEAYVPVGVGAEGLLQKRAHLLQKRAHLLGEGRAAEQLPQDLRLAPSAG